MMKKLIKFVAPLFMTMMLLGCEGDGGSAPVGSTLAIVPPEVQWDVANPGACDPTVFNDTLFSITASQPNGQPLGETNLLITLWLADNTSSVPVMSLIADNNGNGVVDAGDETVSELGDGGYGVTTNNQGNVRVIVRMTLSCTYRGNLTVSGPSGLFASASLAVEEAN